MIGEGLSRQAEAALGLVATRMAAIEGDLGVSGPEERAKRLTHLAVDIQAGHARAGGEDTPQSIIEGAAVALLVAALAVGGGP
jgi:hypothetical protein